VVIITIIAANQNRINILLVFSLASGPLSLFFLAALWFWQEKNKKKKKWPAE
jgi:hypothetical protein